MGNTSSNHFSVRNMDKKVDPFVDFYSYSCGAWLKKHKVPSNKTSIDSFSFAHDETYAKLRKLVESAGNSTNERIVKAFYNSFMDKKARNAKAFLPIKGIIGSIEKIGSRKGIAEGIAMLAKKGGFSAFFDFDVAEDSKNSSIYALYFWQGGITLPNRDYYLKKEFAGTLKDYAVHIERMFRMYGMGAIKERASAIISIETALAKASRQEADLRDPIKNYNKFALSKAEKAYKHIGIKDFCRIIGAGAPAYVIICQPEFFDAVDSMLAKRKLFELKAYMEWIVISDAAPLLHSYAVKEHFDFFGRKLSGQKAMLPEWRKAIALISAEVGEALGSLYIKKYFSGETEAMAKALVENIKGAFRKRLEKVEWMEPKTKRMALEKFDAIRAKLGYPKKFRDYSKLKTSMDLFSNVLSAENFELKRAMSKIGKKVDKEEWDMNVFSANAYYSPSKNEIVMPAGIFVPPFFDIKKDDAVNYAGIGGIIGHELTHGYDDQGSKFDKHGNLRCWWTKKDKRSFAQRTYAIVDLYSSLEILPGLNVNGKLTLGENIADLGGIRIAYDALQMSISKDPSKMKAIDGFTPVQRFFIAWAQLWKGRILDKEARKLALIDPHSPMKYRGMVPPMTHPAFNDAFKAYSKLKEPKIRSNISLW
ncbi:MAG: M13 family metallopeptidase [Candidatus Micrarchaeaceae archaeon]